MESVRKHRDIKIIKTKGRKKYLVSEPNYHTRNFFLKICSKKKMRKKHKMINKIVYLGLSILKLSKIVIHQFWYDYTKPKYGEKANLCYIDLCYLAYEAKYQFLIKKRGKSSLNHFIEYSNDMDDIYKNIQ